MIKKYVIFSLIALVSCSPSEEKLKIKSDEIYNRAKDISSSEPCIKLTSYKIYQNWESSTQTSFYSEIVSQEIKLYEELCSKKNIAIQDEINRKAELRKLGSWKIGNYFNEFGDKTGKKIYLFTKTKDAYGNDYMVYMYLSNGSLEQPQFNFYEYLISDYDPNPVTYYSGNNCLVKDNSDIFPIKLYQGKNYLFTTVNDKTDKDVQKLRILIKEEGIAKFSCDGKFSNNKLRFDINFKYYSNALRKMNQDY